MKKIVLGILMSFIFFGFAISQTKTEKENEMRQLIESKQFKFTARSVTPLSGTPINLTSEYDLIVDSLKIEAWLPFYGRAYQTDYGSTEGGIKFKEVAKTMDVKLDKKKKIYNIRIEVDTPKDSYKIYIQAGSSGYANMNLNSYKKQSVSYYGIIEAIDK